MKHFGLVGNSLTHSFSKEYFAKKFQKEAIINASYELFELQELKSIDALIKSEQLNGFNVTIPYKEKIIPYLTSLDSIASIIGAVNTVLIRGEERIGFNTDIIGFKKSIRPFLAKEHSRALILGTGGASKAIATALKHLDINFFYVSSSLKTEKNIINYSDLDDTIISTFPLIVNCTPLGTFPKIEDIPPIPLDGIGHKHLIFDLIYNPKESKLISEAKSRGALICNGLNMLKIQAEESWKIWNS